MAVQNIDNVLQTIALKAYVSKEAVTKLNVFAHNYTQDFAEKHDTVHVPIVAAGEAKDLGEAADGKYTSDGKLSTAAIHLDHHVYSSMDISNETFKKFAPQVHADTANAQAMKVARKMMNLIAAGVDKDCASQTQTAPTTFAALKALKKTVSKYSRPILVLNAADYDTLVTDQDLMNIAALSGKDLLATGTIYDLCGFRVVRADISTPGFVCDDGTIGFASALTATDSNASQPIVDEASGCTMLVKYIDNGNPPTVTALTEVLFGYQLVNKDRIVGFKQGG